ncbi:MAG TPA: protease inhibitor I42 family protein [Abditibacteriaceae bacterium]|jgi:predicted secreted protein
MKRLQRMGIASALAMALPFASFIVTARAQVASVTETVVTEADNGTAVTLNPGAVLVVRLSENPSTGYSRAMVSFPNMPIRLVSHRVLPKAASADGAPVVGAPQVSEWRFVANGESAVGRATWLKFLTLRPFAKGVDTAGLWEVKVTVPGTPAN